MSLAAVEFRSASGPPEAGKGLLAPRLAGLVLVRLAAVKEGIAEGDLARDLHGIVAHQLQAGAWQRMLEQIVAELKAARQATVVDQRLEVTANGKTAAAQFLGLKKFPTGTWPDVRDCALMAMALGLEKEPASRLKALAKLDGLRGLVVISAFKLKVRGKPTASRLRAALAVAALERAFGGQIKHGLGERPGLSAKSGRLLAGQLSARPRDFGTDSRLVAALAAEAVNAPRSELAPLRLAILRRFVSAPGSAAPPLPNRPRKVRATRGNETPPAIRSSAAMPDVLPPTDAAQVKPPARPDPAGFARTVRAAARLRAEGWSGNRKALISRVWHTLRADRPEWALTEIEFKCMLSEAHRCGLLNLAGADLKEKRDLKELQESAVSYKNAVWHFIRVED